MENTPEKPWKNDVLSEISKKKEKKQWCQIERAQLRAHSKMFWIEIVIDFEHFLFKNMTISCKTKIF